MSDLVSPPHPPTKIHPCHWHRTVHLKLHPPVCLKVFTEVYWTLSVSLSHSACRPLISQGKCQLRPDSICVHEAFDRITKDHPVASLIFINHHFGPSRRPPVPVIERRRSPSCLHVRSTGSHRWSFCPHILFSPTSLSLSLPSTLPNWPPVGAGSCRMEEGRFWLQSRLSGAGRWMRRLPGWARQRGLRTYLSGLPTFSSPPSISLSSPLSVFLSASPPLFFLFLSRLPRQATDGKRLPPLLLVLLDKSWSFSRPRRNSNVCHSCTHERIPRTGALGSSNLKGLAILPDRRPS